jgi:hypothetical protein
MRCVLLRMLLLLVAMLASSVAKANNNLYLPGDAYFPTELTADKLRSLQEQEAGAYVFDYNSFGGYEGAFCGYAGYHHAQITTVDKQFLANLAKAYAQIRKYEAKELRETVNKVGKTQLMETNGVRVLFYPKEMEFPKFKIGLRYNEHWGAEAMKFGHSREHLRLCELVDSGEAVAESWHDARLFGTFDVVLPKLETDVADDDDVTAQPPIVIKSKVQAIVLMESRPLKDYWQPRQGYIAVLVVDSAGIVSYQFNEGVWKAAEETP